MTTYVLRRLAATALLLFGTSILVFLILRLIPGDPAVVMLGTNAGSAEMVRNLHHQLGLDKPLPTQYLTWISGLLSGNLGYSYDQNMPVTTLIADNFPYTVQLTVAGLGISVIAGLAIGIVAALNRNTFIDTLTMGIALIGTSIPSFWLGLVLLLLFAVQFHWLPVFGGTSIQGLILPALSLGIGGAGFTARFVRSAVIDALRQQYVITARSKGLTNRRVVVRHVLRNAVLPILTIVGLQFGSLLSGAVIIETVFSRPGIGRELVEGILNKDYLVVQGIVFLVAFLYIMSNLAVDLLYPVFDPRIKR